MGAQFVQELTSALPRQWTAPAAWSLSGALPSAPSSQCLGTGSPGGAALRSAEPMDGWFILLGDARLDESVCCGVRAHTQDIVLMLLNCPCLF